MKKKRQILMIHGGMTFKSKNDFIQYLQTREILLEKNPSWSGEYLDTTLGADFEIIRPRMPLSENAKYEEWKIHFERYIPLLRDEVILIGVSLGGIFLAKYLSENTFSKIILSTYLVCPPFDDSLSSEDLVGGFKLKANLSLLESNSQNLYLLFSEDDDVVPVAHAKKYLEKLPNAKICTYKSKNGHFKVPKFPEIVKMVLKDTNKK